MSERFGPKEYDEYFRRIFRESRNCNAVSAQMNLNGKCAFEILREFTDLWKEKYTDYAPETVLEALIMFGTERNVTTGEIVRVAYHLGRTFDADFAQKRFQISTT